MNQHAVIAAEAPSELWLWALEKLQLPQVGSDVEVVAGDASHRRYFRLRHGSARYILVDAPPETEKNDAFLAVQEALHAAGVRVPAMLAADLQRGYLLLEDLGSQLLLPQLDAQSVDTWYQQALATTLVMGQVRTAPVPAYDRALLTEELSRFPHWFLGKLLNISLTKAERTMLAELDAVLVDSALAQPKVLVHRDFHSRNLMLVGGELAVIDFQDAVYGPLTYDAVSLLKDCYVRWPRARVEAWVAGYREQLIGAALLTPEVDITQFQRWFDLMGLQRHLKVLGVFARLYLRDGKPAYLQDLPRVCVYVEEVFDLYAAELPALAVFRDWWQARLAPVTAEQAWAQAL